MLQTAGSQRKAQSTGDNSHLRAAKDMTSAEFRENFRRMLWEMHKQLDAQGLSMQDFMPWFSWDHNYAQEYANLEFDASEVPPGMGYVPGQEGKVDFKNVRMPLPKYSPDAHRVIEHVFGQLSAKLRTTLVTNAHELNSGPAIAAWVQQHFYQIKPSSIAKDAEGLPELHRWIRDNDGAWAPRKMR